MGRTVKTFTFGYYPQGLINATHDFLISEGYKYKEKKGEKVYQKGMGILTAPSFIKVTVENNYAKIEAWIKVAILPGVYAGEDDLKSFVGAAVKGPLKKRFAHLENMMIQFGGCPVDENMLNQPIYYQPPVPQNNYQQYAPQNAYRQMPQQPMYEPQQPAPQSQKRFCTKCGATVEAGTNFCMSCGTRIQ